MLTGIPFPSANSNCPEQLEYMDGIPQAIASINGKFHPSDLAQDTKESHDLRMSIYSVLEGKCRTLIRSSSRP